MCLLFRNVTVTSQSGGVRAQHKDQTGMAKSEQFFVSVVFAVIDFRVNQGQNNKR